MDFEYIIANNQVTIIKYTGSSKDVTIPNNNVMKMMMNIVFKYFR